MSPGAAVSESVAELPDALREAVRDLILCLADSKRLLGMRYAGWILGAPELEAGIACASMAQDEWGHARLLYAMLRDFGEEVERIEHGREPAEYRAIAVLDEEPQSWAGLVALNALIDTALSVQFDALRDSSYAPLRQRVEKLLEEERFHQAHGAAWFRRMAAAEGARAELEEAALSCHYAALEWFGPDSGRASALVDAGVLAAAGGALRERYQERVAPLLELLGDSGAVGLAFDGFDEASRRPARAAGPDAETVRRIRGDKNRAFLMD